MADDPSTIPTSLRGQLARQKRSYIGGALLIVAFQVTLNRIDWLAKESIDGVFGEHPEQVVRPALLILILALIAFAVRIPARWLFFNAGRDAEFELRTVLVHRLHRLGTAFFRKMSAGEIMSRSGGDLGNVRMLLGFGTMLSFFALVAFASALQVMIGVSGRLTLVSLLVVPLLIGATRKIGRQIFIRGHESQTALGKLTARLQTNLTGIRVIRTFALEASERERFDEVNRACLNASLASARVHGLIGPLVGAVSAVGILIIFWYGAGLMLRGEAGGGISRGSFFAFWLAYERMIRPIMAIGFAIAMIQRGRASHARLKAIFDASPDVTDGPHAAPASVAGAISVRGLSFAYGERKIIDGVSFEVPAGSSIAIVGRTGSGKSSVAMLLARLLPTPRGTVFIDGQDVCDLPVAAVREHVGYTQQDAFLFSSTVAYNIGFPLDDAESPAAVARIHAAARDAQVEEEVMRLPDQFATVVGERGVQLSGGQKQRVALARALIREPEVLVLDDPLSAVDAKTEAAVLDAIERQAKERTVILVTHRVPAARRCDRIIVVDGGKVIDRGTHDELVARKGLYASFAAEQSAMNDLDAIELEDVGAPAKPKGVT